jgi:hypothetical protein
MGDQTLGTWTWATALKNFPGTVVSGHQLACLDSQNLE